jgi:hypothetical protein
MWGTNKSRGVGSMEKDKKVWEVAKTLVMTHGGKAPVIAREHAKERKRSFSATARLAR